MLPSGFDNIHDIESKETILGNLNWNESSIFGYWKQSNESDTSQGEILQKETKLNSLVDVEKSLVSSLGGLEPQIDAIIRRILDGRTLSPTNETMNTESEQLASLGLHPVQGLLLYGPPGYGKVSFSNQLPISNNLLISVKMSVLLDGIGTRTFPSAVYAKQLYN